MFNGTSSRMVSTAFTSLGKASWTLRCRFNLQEYNTTAGYSTVFTAENADYLGVVLNVASSGATILYLSSTGTTWDITDQTSGTIDINLDTWYTVELTFDSLAGEYRLYINGAQSQTISSTAIVCPVTSLNLGAHSELTYYWDGYIQDFEFLPYCQHPAGTTYAVPTTAPNIATPGYAADFFSIPDMKMYQVSGPSNTIGWNPTFTEVNRVYVGEAATNSTGVSYVTNYALNGRYDSGLFPVVASMAYNKNHNLGYSGYVSEVRMADDMNGTNERYATNVYGNGSTMQGWYAGMTTRNSTVVNTEPYVGLSASGAIITTGYYRVMTNRGW
jgi:hypothetical protein